MLPAEINYPVTEKETLGIICALREWRHYLHGSPFPVTVKTDHKPLVFLPTQTDLMGRRARWSQFLQEFDLTIEYEKGKENVVADSLSRGADHQLAVVVSLEEVGKGMRDKIKQA